MDEIVTALRHFGEDAGCFLLGVAVSIEVWAWAQWRHSRHGRGKP